MTWMFKRDAFNAMDVRENNHGHSLWEKEIRSHLRHDWLSQNFIGIKNFVCENLQINLWESIPLKIYRNIHENMVK